MTLCLAWKQNSGIYFASDSRLMTNGRSVLTDNATKIFKIDVEVRGVSPNEELIHRTNFGLCFAGSYLNGSIIADFISGDSVEYTSQSLFRLFNREFSQIIAVVIYKSVST